MQPAIAGLSIALLLFVLLYHRQSAKQAVKAAAGTHTNVNTIKIEDLPPPQSLAKLTWSPASVSHRSGEAEMLHQYKSLFHKLHNIEQHKDVLPVAHQILKDLMRECMQSEVVRGSGHSSILSIEEYHHHHLSDFLKSEHEIIFEQYERYVQRRRVGGRPELFRNRAEACAWLARNAPSKFVDGAWLGDIHQVDTPFALRSVTRSAFQILSEELGDGDLDKNHVHLYRELLRTAGVQLPRADSLEFVEADLGMSDGPVWRTAVGQLVISLFPHLYLPEILGFNLHFEILTLDTLKAAKELPLVGLSAMYFLVHISVDNADSGHTAQALQAVQQYMAVVEAYEGHQAAEDEWRRVQAGFIMSKNLGHEGNNFTPREPYDPLNPVEGEVLRMLRAKADVSQRLHCASRVKIGGQALADWLSPESLGDERK